ncbi:MAG TPA: metalloregulator ArsR/SmtB family transcription factor [Solirubrobacteraceae bacterium]|nr:metalloregulator ArsR/SmtB family transcription factor [Solirubrobacteraceae bacterium]
MLEVLGEPVRREIVERLVKRPSAVTDLAAEMPISRSAVSQHLQVLKRAQIVQDRPAGTQRIYHVDPDALAILRAYFESFWSRSLDTFRALADADHRKEPEADDSTG